MRDAVASTQRGRRSRWHRRHSAGSAAPSRSRPAIASRSSSVRPTASARRARSPSRCIATTRSGSTSWRCVPTTWCARAPNPSRSSTTWRSAVSIRSAWRSSSGRWRSVVGRPAARSSAARPPSTRGSCPRTRSTSPGSCIGVVEREALIDGSAVRAGDAILGLAASGLHANGYSLVRSLIAQWDLDLGRPYQEQLRRSLGDADRDSALVAEPEHGLATLGEVLLTPTRIYARGVLAARRSLLAGGHDLRGLAHITGGGLPGNVPRALPAGLGARVDPGRWPMPSVMRLFGALGGHRGRRASGDLQRRDRDGRGRGSGCRADRTRLRSPPKGSTHA